ncbi:RNA recognition motif domain, eukaryote [Ophiocordyceps sinensis CO18]|uniref:RNA recognition motif domain, eukaryote n=1 Tax=Ophiocordyceps sinensis (strain Co18 / CGMCC 3.14243) TaxID=911162 RepID=T5AJQ2_OPHSC|nr:RNA recognition motif domain, eukaryote [Ophiocordyceps sinensis CO18]
MAPQDSFIEEEEDVCPLCIEDLDLSDRNFRPCPCGYQVCQFCFNNIKNNMNGLCPACRRPYDEKTIQWKVVTSEEVAEFRANIQKNQKKRAQEQRQKEVQKREAEKENRKNLIGVRVVQKNLVYITGLAPTVREDELLKTLRKPEFFGQYGNIQKISISNRKSSDGQHHSLGIYVTFERPEEATRCIQAVHGSQNGDRVLKAQHGTTKYCSAWLKNEKCNNPGCMFLHEQGDEEDSYTRQDLSSMNSIHTQRPLPGGGGGSSSRAASRQQPAQPTPPPAAQPMARSTSKEGGAGEGGTGSHATSGAASSPAVSTSLPAAAETAPQVGEDAEASPAGPVPKHKRSGSYPVGSHVTAALDKSLRDLLKTLEACTLPRLDNGHGGEADPPMFDVRGGEKRRAVREEEDTRVGDPEEPAEVQMPSEAEPETGGGSLALGGEPEERDMVGDGHNFDQRQANSQPPIQRASIDGLFGAGLGSSHFGQGSGRAMTPQHLASLRSQQGGFGEQMPQGISNQSSMFQGQGHNRQTSRFSFANDNANSVTNVKLAANSRIMAQQSSMMPNSFQSQGGNQFYGTSMPGPPPGLKSTGTPPSMFGQPFGGSGFGAAPKDSSNDLLQSLIGRNRGGGNQPHDAGKREYMISSFSNQYLPSSASTPAPASGLLASLYGNHAGAFQDLGSKQKKKGKKHRHANTSSSGGSGLVDLVDPSILQARMQHQSQSNAGVGQGVFGGQSQDDELPSLDEAANSVDALVSDEPQGVFAQPQHTRTAEAESSALPGFAPPHRHPEALSKPGTAPSRSRPPSLVPAVPKFSALGLEHGAVTPEQTPRKAAHGSTFAVEYRPSKAASSQAQQSQFRGSATLQDEDFPALNAPRAREPQPASPAISFVPTPKGTPAPKRSADKVSVKMDKAVLSPVASPAPFFENSSTKDGLANDDTARFVAGLAEDAWKSEGSADHSSAPPPLRTVSAGTASSPIQRASHRSIRVMPTARAEGPALPSPAHSVASKSVSLPHIPDTPWSEMISDTASLLSASVSASRVGSPPPSRIGSASVRSTTKSQLRKQRKEALKLETKVMSEASKAEPEEHAPVIGRKKKQKKEKPARASANQPRPDLTQEPVPDDKSTVKSVVQEEAVMDKVSSEEAETKPKASPQKKSSKGKGRAKDKDQEKEDKAAPPAASSQP